VLCSYKFFSNLFDASSDMENLFFERFRNGESFFSDSEMENLMCCVHTSFLATYLMHLQTWRIFFLSDSEMENLMCCVHTRCDMVPMMG
jgi:hypothetical protein